MYLCIKVQYMYMYTHCSTNTVILTLIFQGISDSLINKHVHLHVHNTILQWKVKYMKRLQKKKAIGEQGAFSGREYNVHVHVDSLHINVQVKVYKVYTDREKGTVQIGRDSESTWKILLKRQRGLVVSERQEFFADGDLIGILCTDYMYTRKCIIVCLREII